MKKPGIFLVLLLSILTLGANAAKKTELKLHLTKGTVYDSKIDMENHVDQNMMGQQMTIHQDIEILAQMKVVDVLANGNYKIEQTYNDLNFTMEMNGKVTNLDSVASKPLEAMKNMVISYEVTPDGKVSNIQGVTEMLEKLGTNPQVAGVLKGMASFDQLAAFYSYLPKEAVEVGDTYEVKLNNAELMNLETITKYTVKDISKDNVTLDVALDLGMDSGKTIQQNGMDMNIKANGKQIGDFVVSRKDGMPLSSTLDMDMHMEISFKNPKTGDDMNMPMDMKMKVISIVTKK